ncbi:hypothetical protein LguiB_030346 [Lonicera macranthoides]
MQSQQQLLLQLMSNLSSTSTNSPPSHIVVPAPDASHPVDSVVNRQEMSSAAVNKEADVFCTASPLPQHSNTFSSHSIMPLLAPDGSSNFSPSNCEVLGQKQSTVPTSVAAIVTRSTPGVSDLPQVLHGSSSVTNTLHGSENGQVEISPLGVGILGQKSSDSMTLDSELVRILQQQQCDAAQISTSLGRPLPTPPTYIQLQHLAPIQANVNVFSETYTSTPLTSSIDAGDCSPPKHNHPHSPTTAFTQEYNALSSGQPGAVESTLAQQAQQMQEESNRTTDSRTKLQQKRKSQSSSKSNLANPLISANAGSEIPSTVEPSTFNNVTSVETPNPSLFNAMPPPHSTINATTTLLTHPNSYIPSSNENVGFNHQLSNINLEPTLGRNAHIDSSQQQGVPFTFHPQAMQSHDSINSSSTNSVESFVPDTLPAKQHTSPTMSNDSINSYKPTQSPSINTSSNSFAPLTGKFWGDEEDEPPIQSFVHSAEENMGLSDPQLCVQLEEDLDTSVLNQETPEHLKSTGYISSLYSDSSPSISKTLQSPSESEYQPSSPINSSPNSSSTPFTPAVPLIITTSNKAKKKKAKKDQAKIDAMIKAGLSQPLQRSHRSSFHSSSCQKQLPAHSHSSTKSVHSHQICSSRTDISQLSSSMIILGFHYLLYSQKCCTHAQLPCCFICSEILNLRAQFDGVNKSPKNKEILRDRNGYVELSNLLHRSSLLKRDKYGYVDNINQCPLLMILGPLHLSSAPFADLVSSSSPLFNSAPPAQESSLTVSAAASVLADYEESSASAFILVLFVFFGCSLLGAYHLPFHFKPTLYSFLLRLFVHR